MAYPKKEFEGSIPEESNTILDSARDRDERPGNPPEVSAWKGTWDRPLKVDPDSYDKLTIARMTDHNVRGHED